MTAKHSKDEGMRFITWECDDADCAGTVDVAECYDAGTCPVCDGPMHETASYEDRAMIHSIDEGEQDESYRNNN